MIQELETLAKLPPQVRKDIERYCAIRGCEYADILRATEGDKILRGLIRHLAANGHSIRTVSTGTGVQPEDVYKIVKDYRADQVRIKTFNYERITSCR